VLIQCYDIYSDLECEIDLYMRQTLGHFQLSFTFMKSHEETAGKYHKADLVRPH